METDRRDAAALRTIGISSELARSHSSFQISSDRVSGLRKNTFIGIGWRAQETFNHSSGHIQLQVSLAQLEQLLHDAPAGRRRQAVVAGVSAMGGNDGHPRLFYLLLPGPESYELSRITHAVC